jgi:ABC-type sugar transport system substrate-binding protein
MLGMRFTRYALSAALLAAAMAGLDAHSAAQEQHGRKWQPPPPTAPITVTVVKGFNNKPFENAGVVFRAVRDGKSVGTLEVKSDPDGNAKIDILEVGSHVLVQVIASGFATAAAEFDLTAEGKQLTLKLQRPQAQVSQYVDNDGKASQTKPGVQERVIPPNAAVPKSNPQ